MTHIASSQTLTSTYRVGAQAVRIYRAQLSAALEALASTHPNATNVHAARKDLKRARATLRLMRNAIDPRHYHKEDAAVRAASHLLNDIRDAEVLLRTFDRLRAAVDSANPRAELKPLRRALAEARHSCADGANTDALVRARSLLQQSKARTFDWFVANGGELFSEGMRRTYRKGRSAFRVARESPTDDRLHALRKQVKYCAYQLDVIATLRPKNVNKSFRQFAQLGKLLGDDHDLAMLQQRGKKADVHGASTILTAQIASRRKKLQKKALALGDRLYRDKPRQFERSVSLS